MQQDYFPQPNKQFRYSPVQISIWCGLLVFGLFLKLMHWPGGALLICVPSGGLLGYNIIALLLLRGSNALNNVFIILGIAWVLFQIWGFIWNNGNPYNEYGIAIHVGAVLLSAIINGLVYRKYIRKLS